MPVIKKWVDKKVAGGKGQWSPKERDQAVAAYVLLGTCPLVAASTGIPELTLRKWRMQEWWKIREAEIRQGQRIELSGRLGTVVQKTLAQLEDRVANGDYIYDYKTKEFTRKPINATTANRIVNDLVSKQLILETASKPSGEGDMDLDIRLKKLKEEMIKFAGAKTIKGEAKVIPEEIPSHA